MATDDSHSYHEFGLEGANPGRGWVMVRAEALDPEGLPRAMEAGDFYSSSGVTLEAIDASSEGLSLSIESEPGVEYRTQFIGTRREYDRTSTKGEIDDGDGSSVLYRYSDEIGEMLAEVEGARPSYSFSGDEICVRARVVSTRLKENPYSEGEFETAWVQPVVLAP